MINETKKIIDCIQRINDSHAAMIDNFSIDAHSDSIFLTIWEREFPIFIDLDRKTIKYDSSLDNCGNWEIDLDDFIIITELMRLIDATLFQQCCVLEFDFCIFYDIIYNINQEENVWNVNQFQNCSKSVKHLMKN